MIELINLELNLRNNLVENEGAIGIEDNISNLDKLTSLILDYGDNNDIENWNTISWNWN